MKYKTRRLKNNKNQIIIWILALITGAVAGCLGINLLNKGFNFIATVFTRLFQFIAVPTIALAVITTLSELGTKKIQGKSLPAQSHILCLQHFQPQL